MIRFQVQGADLNAVYRALRQADPKMAAAIRNGVKKGAQPVVEAVKASAEAQGLSRASAATSVRFASSASRGLTATIAVSHAKAPYARALENGSQGRKTVDRHPVFGHDVWVDQPTRPFFWSAIERSSGQVGQRIKDELDAALRGL